MSSKIELRRLHALPLVCVTLLGCGSDPATPVDDNSQTPSGAVVPAAGTGTTGAAGRTASAGGGGKAAAAGSSAGASNGTGTGTAGSSAAAAGSSAGTAGSSAGPAGPVASAGTSGSVAGAGTAGAAGASGAGTAGNTAAAGSGSTSDLDPFSFFVTSLVAMQKLSNDQNGFGGDLRFGKADGLSGADEICRQIAETSMPGSSAKTWRAFLSVTKGPDGKPVNAIDRVGEGPWYDRRGRLVAMNKANLAQLRPVGADPAIANDLPNEDGVPNHAPDGNEQVDNHDILTGSGPTGLLYKSDWSVTCHDWTSAVGSDGKPRVGHSWPRSIGGGGTRPGGGGGSNDMANWMSALDEAGCAKGVSIIEMGPPDPNDPTVGSGGGYGGIYCFALMP